MSHVYASTGLIGDESQGGSWQLDAVTQPRAAVPFSQEARKNFFEILSSGPPKFSNTPDSTTTFLGDSPLKIFSDVGFESGQFNSFRRIVFEVTNAKNEILENSRFSIDFSGTFDTGLADGSTDRLIYFGGTNDFNVVGLIDSSTGGFNSNKLTIELQDSNGVAYPYGDESRIEFLIREVTYQYAGSSLPDDSSFRIKVEIFDTNGNPGSFSFAKEILNPVKVEFTGSSFVVAEDNPEEIIAGDIGFQSVEGFSAVSASIDNGTTGDQFSLLDAPPRCLTQSV